MLDSIATWSTNLMETLGGPGAGLAVALENLIPLVRSMISVPAGVERMRPLVFIALTALGSGLWNAAFIVAGYLLGENWQLVEDYVGMYSTTVLVLMTLAIVFFIAVRVSRVGRQRARSRDTTDRNHKPSWRN